MAMRRKVLAGAAAVLAVGGAGAGLAATKLTATSPRDESRAIVKDAAENLGVSPDRLRAALEKAFSDRIDAAVADGRLTKEQGEELKQRIESGDFPLFGPPVFGQRFPAVHPFFHGLDAAASYLGLSEPALRSRLNSGKTLAQIARAQGKSVDELNSALLDDVKQKLDDAVAAGRLSKSEEQRVLNDLESRIDDLVNAQLRLRFRDHRGPLFDRGFDRHGPPPFLPGAAA
jgi:polyhydroxyalkanoate synthesis regulator phasin